MGGGFRRCERTSESAASGGLDLNCIVLIIIDGHSSICCLKMFVQVIWLPGAMISNSLLSSLIASCIWPAASQKLGCIRRWVRSRPEPQDYTGEDRPS